MANAPLQRINDLKGEAITLRQDYARRGHPLSHSQALELIAKHHGFRDWNAARASAAHTIKMVKPIPGQSVRGEYLGQAFRGQIKAVQLVGATHLRVSIHLENAVDVVKFSSFSSWRKRISGTLASDGVSPERCSDNTPHLVVFNT